MEKLNGRVDADLVRRANTEALRQWYSRQFTKDETRPAVLWRRDLIVEATPPPTR